MEAATPGGILTAIFISPVAGAPMERRQQVAAIAGLGLEGDRYAAGEGSFSRWPGPGREVSLIAEKDLIAVREASGIDLLSNRSGAHRRNLVVRGLDLEALLQRDFRVGEALLHGERPCRPCRYLDRVSGLGLYEVLKNHGGGGLRARVVEGGWMAVRDRVG
ncbi:MAG: MOSC domain-containing protein [Sumerlaeia bacterium]